MLVTRLLDTNLVKRTEESLIYVPFNTEQEEITMRSAKFRKCAKRTKTNSDFHSGRFELGLCDGNHELCDARAHFALDFLTITTY